MVIQNDKWPFGKYEEKCQPYRHSLTSTCLPWCLSTRCKEQQTWIVKEQVIF